MIGTLTALFLVAAAGPAEEFARDAEGVWTSAEQSQSEAYDYVISETIRAGELEPGVPLLYQQNWLVAAQREGAASPAKRHDKRPYFQVLIALRDFGDGTVHTTTFRIPQDARQAARGWAKRPSRAFQDAWRGEIACMGEMQRVGEGFWRGGTSCPNGYKGGVRVDSRSVRAPSEYVNWDRGFDVDGNLKWGPPEGGYIFKRWESE